jgi:C_GCAxxG_C_C family probable redox protein
MADYEALKARVEELAERAWDVPAIEARIQTLSKDGIPKKALDPQEMLAHKDQILARVELRAEEYNFIARNCAKGTALAILEEFGLGSMDMVQAMSPFPGFGGTGWMCGGVTGSLIALGLYFGSDDVLNYDAVGATIMASRQFMARFEEKVGSVVCPKIHEDIVFGRYMDPAASPENMEAFAVAKGFEKCGLLPGIGARITAEIIIEGLG